MDFGHEWKRDLWNVRDCSWDGISLRLYCFFLETSYASLYNVFLLLLFWKMEELLWVVKKCYFVGGFPYFKGVFDD